MAEFDNKMTTILQQSLSSKQPIHFIPTAISDEAEYINGVFTYILHISGFLINERKAIVNIMGIKPFFDVVVPVEISLPTFKTRLVNILLQKIGDILNAKYEEDIVFMICMTVHWKDDPELLKQICLIDVETAPDSRLITIICGSQKAKKLGVLEWMFNHMSIKPSGIEKILKWQYQYNTIKVNDRQFHSKHHKILGCVAIDVQPCFMGFHPKAEKNSLAFYLNESGLESKLDMPIHHMNKYMKRH
ncbi:15916_t:CDS:2 [Funneliformis geosporum]|nr:15916_t:CDS:2 [Funneliformis geosporum]